MNYLRKNLWEKLMGKTYAVAGKGGVGKTTFSALLIKYLLGNNFIPILAVDADPNANLGETLGLNTIGTLAEIRDFLRNNPDKIPIGMSKETYMDMSLQKSLIESKGFDLLVMGHPEGPGCYCYANNLIRRYLDKLSGSYPYVVIDNEAGLEHISRLTTNNVDILFLISDSSRRSLKACMNIKSLIGSLPVKVKELRLVINRADINEVKDINTYLEQNNIVYDCILPEDEFIEEYDYRGKAFIDLPDESKIVKATKNYFNRISFI